MMTVQQVLHAGKKAAKFLGYKGLKDDHKSVLISRGPQLGILVNVIRNQLIFFEIPRFR